MLFRSQDGRVRAHPDLVLNGDHGGELRGGGASADYFDSFADMLLSRSSHLERLARDLRGMSWGEGPEEDEGAGARPTDGDASRSTPDAGRSKE